MKQKSRGMSLLELAVAGVLLAGFAVVCLKFFAAQVRHRLALAERHVAQQELANLMERLAARPYEDLSTEALAGEKITPRTASVLSNANLKIEVAADGPPSGKRITLRITWPGIDPAAPLTVQLTSWRYPASSPSPSGRGSG
jgi:hypothetical protein